jgi:hypothetical protein
MHSVLRAIFISFAAYVFCSSMSPLGWAQEERIDLKFQEQTFSADLEEAPLGAIIKRFKEEKGIWFKGKESLLDEKVSVQFKDLPIREGLERILSAMNYSLIFDGEARLVGVVLVGKSGAISGQSERTRRVTPRTRAPSRRSLRGVLPPPPRD